MRIALDVRPALTKNSRRRGIGKYTIELAKALLANAEQRHEFLLYGCGPERLELSQESGEGRHGYRSVFRLARPSRLAWLPDRIVLPRLLSKDRIDIYHSNDIASIVFHKRTRTVVTVHDLIPLIFWKEMSPAIPIDYAFALRQGFRRAAKCDLIITDSEQSRSDICGRLRVPRERVKVVFPGCSPSFRPRDREGARERLRERYGIRTRFLLYVGGSDFRKNLSVLVEAFRDILRTGYDGSLVMVGETFHWDIGETRRLRDQIAQRGIGDRVLFPGYVGDEDLPDFYSACDMFVFPSLYEGFGLPVVEALACGAIALVTRCSAVPEVAGDAAEYFDPRDARNIVQAFSALFHSPQRQSELREKGPAQAGRFSWDQAARQILALYDELTEAGPTRGR